MNANHRGIGSEEAPAYQQRRRIKEPKLNPIRARKFCAVALRVGWLAAALVFCLTSMQAEAAAVLTNSLSAQGAPVISWSGRGALEAAAQLSGPWLAISNAASPYTNQSMTGAGFFRLNQTVDATTL